MIHKYARWLLGEYICGMVITMRTCNCERPDGTPSTKMTLTPGRSSLAALPHVSLLMLITRSQKSFTLLTFSWIKMNKKYFAEFLILYYTLKNLKWPFFFIFKVCSLVSWFPDDTALLRVPRRRVDGDEQPDAVLGAAQDLRGLQQHRGLPRPQVLRQVAGLESWDWAFTFETQYVKRFKLSFFLK